MASIHQYYLDHMFSETGYRATWEPSRKLQLGDIITLEKGVFSIQSSLAAEGIAMQEAKDPSQSTLDYTSNRSVKIGTKLVGQIPMVGSALTEGDAGFSIEFSNEKAIVFQADAVRTKQIINLGEIEQEVVRRVKGSGKEWRKNWLIVTQLIEAETATIILSYSRNSKLELKASANVGTGQLKLTNAALGLDVASEQGSHWKTLAKEGISPLYRVMGYQHPLFGQDGLKTKDVIDAETKEHIEEEGFKLQNFNSLEIEE